MLFLTLGCGGAPDVPAGPADSEVHDHASHAHDGGMAAHMEAMASTRERLRGELRAAYEAPVPGLDAADPSRGRALFEASCAVCHGEAGKGDGPGGAGLSPPPADFTDAFHARYYSDAGRVDIIRHGVPGTGMAGFDGRLPASDILDIYAHVRTLRGD